MSIDETVSNTMGTAANDIHARNLTPTALSIECPAKRILKRPRSSGMLRDKS